LPSTTGADKPEKPPKSLLRQVVGRPTGRNGYEEFLAAADLLKSSKIWKQAEGKQLSLAEKHLVLSDRKLQRALALLRKGVRKPVDSPRDGLDFTTLLPEFSAFRSLGRLLALQQYVLYANGRTADALETLRLGLRFGSLIQQDGLISGLVGLAIDSLVIREAGRHLEQLSAADCERLADICGERLAAPDPLPRVLESERAGIKRSLRTIFAEQPATAPKALGLEGDAAARRLAQEFTQAHRDDERRRAMLAALDRRVDEAFRRVYDAYRRPPWERVAPEVKSDGSVGGSLLALTMPSIGGSFTAYTRAETKIRLLAVHAAIRRYRWETMRLPGNLDALNLGGLAVDPFTGRPFKYVVAGDAYQLTSAGPSAGADDPDAVDGRRPVSVTP